MSRTAWPQRCTLADAARLFTELGFPIDRSNLSRFVSNRNFAREQGKVDPNALFDVWHNDHTRRTMAGQTGGAPRPPPPPAPSAAAQPAWQPPAPPFLGPDADPRRELHRLQTQKLRMEMETAAGKLVPVEEVAAAAAAAVAEYRAAFAESLNDAANSLLKQLGQPAHRLPAVKAALKAFANLGQEKFAAKFAALLDESTPADTTSRARIDILVAYDLELRGEATPEPEIADAPASDFELQEP